MDTIEQQIAQLLHDELGRSLDADAPLTDLGVDSLRMAELAGSFEKRFRIRVDQDLMDAETIRELADYVRARQR